jgi:hypothetical protein
MIKPKCIICGKKLLGGYQKIIYEEIDKMDIPQEEKDELKKLPEQVEYYVHDPRDIHRDIPVYVHKSCFDKVKAIYPNFDNPTQDDYSNVQYPIINKFGNVEMKKLKDFLNLKRL